MKIIEQMMAEGGEQQVPEVDPAQVELPELDEKTLQTLQELAKQGLPEEVMAQIIEMLKQGMPLEEILQMLSQGE
jgi:hypothetical protein